MGVLNRAGHSVSLLAERQSNHFWLLSGNLWFPALIHTSVTFLSLCMFQGLCLPVICTPGTGGRGRYHLTKDTTWLVLWMSHWEAVATQLYIQELGYIVLLLITHCLIFLSLMHMSLQAVNSWRAETMTCFLKIISKWQATIWEFFKKSINYRLYY